MHMAYEEMFWYGCHSGFYNGLDIFIKKFPAKLASILKFKINTNENILFSCISKNSICTLRYFDKKK